MDNGGAAKCAEPRALGQRSIVNPAIEKAGRVGVTGASRIDNRIDRPANGYNTFDWGPVGVSDEEMPDGKMAAWGQPRKRRWVPNWEVKQVSRLQLVSCLGFENA